MSSIKETLVIRAEIAKVWSALTTQAGYTGWWSKDCQIGAKPGDESKLTFDKQGQIVKMRFRIDEIAANKTVRWTCVAHDMESWIGTTLRWDLRDEEKATVVSFEHAGWKGDEPEAVVQGWRHFLSSLRSFVETGTGQPW